MIGVLWPTGSRDRAETWEAMEELLRSRQWSEFQDPESFRAEMAARAGRWSGVEIEVDGSPADFFFELERAGMLVMLHWVPGPSQIKAGRE
jgi:hypothetical protein